MLFWPNLLGRLVNLVFAEEVLFEIIHKKRQGHLNQMLKSLPFAKDVKG